MRLIWLLFFLGFSPTKKNEQRSDEECLAMFFCYHSKYLTEATNFNENKDKEEMKVAKSSLELTPATHFLSHSLEGHKIFASEKKDLVTMVADMAWQTVDQYVDKCHYVLITMDSKCQLARQLMRSDFVPRDGFVLLDIIRISLELEMSFLKTFWGDSSTTCRSLLIDLTCDVNDILYRFLEVSKLWHLHYVRIVLVGSLEIVHQILLQRAFRNIPQPIYLALEDDFVQQLIHPGNPLSAVGKDAEDAPKVWVYARCLYCGDGNPKVKFLASWPLGSPVPKHFQPFPNQENNLQGHAMRVISLEAFPYVVAEQKTAKIGSIITLGDCLHGWLLKVLSAKLNFSYEVRKGRMPGIQMPNGNWSGISGLFYREEADICLLMSFRSERFPIIDFARTYMGEKLSIVSLKPNVLPRYLVIARPFTVDVWLYLLFIIMLWGITLWIFQRINSLYSRNKSITLGGSIFYSWAVILEDPDTTTPTNIAGQMLLGWWLVTCLIVTTMYKSQLMANLVVERSEPPIDTFKDMVEGREGWRWGMSIRYFKGAPMMFMESSPDPVVKEVHKRIEAMADVKDGLAKVAKGGFSFLNIQYEITMEINSYYTDDTGWTPYYISKRGEEILSDFGLPLRRGLPSSNQIKYLINRLMDAGITEFWRQSLMASAAIENRIAIRKKDKVQDTNLKVSKRKNEEGDSRVLQLSHVWGVFLCLLIGFKISFIVLFLEMITYTDDITLRITNND